MTEERVPDGDRKVLGVLTDRDIVTLVVAKDADARTLKVGDVMTRNPLLISESHALEAALRHMRDAGVRGAFRSSVPEASCSACSRWMTCSRRWLLSSTMSQGRSAASCALSGSCARRDTAWLQRCQDCGPVKRPCLKRSRASFAFASSKTSTPGRRSRRAAICMNSSPSARVRLATEQIDRSPQSKL